MNTSASRPFAENESVLRELKSRGVRAGVLSNGDPAMLDPLLSQSGFASLLDPVLSAHSVERFKTDDAVYALGPAALQLPARDILFVSSNGWDAIGATWYGYTTLWINRAGAPLDPLDTQPSRTGSSLRALLDFFSDLTSTPTAMTDRTTAHGLQVATCLHQFIEREVLPGTGIEPAAFWKGFAAIVHDLAPKNAALLAERDRLQSELDAWHRAHPGPIREPRAYRAFLQKIGYLVPVPKRVKIRTANVDDELARQAGPQLVVPVTNARYALNAANARWGSLYDALYGTDALPEDGGATRGPGYNAVRGAKVIEYCRHVLDRTAPLKQGSHIHSTAYRVVNGKLAVTLKNGKTTAARQARAVPRPPGRCGGTVGDAVRAQRAAPRPAHRQDASDRRGDAAGVSDLVIESAVSTILDLEDSVAVVDADDKVQAYGNWLGILKGTLTETHEQGRQELRAQPEPRPRLRAAARRRARAARPLAAVRAQRRPPDGQPGGAVRRRPGDSRRHPRRGGHHRDRAARPEGRPCERHPQQPHRLDLHRQAEDARARRGGVRGRAVRTRGAAARPARQHGQARHHGRRAPHQREPEGLHRRGVEPRGLHQHRLPRSHRRRDPHRDAGRRR